MPKAETSGRDRVRLNNLDWKLLEIMSDGKRYTQAYLYNDIEELENESADWVRQRVSHLYDQSLIQKIGTSSMYEISELGRAALQVRDEIGEDTTPREITDLIMQEATQSGDTED